MRKNILIISHSAQAQFLESCCQYAQLFDPEKYCVEVIFLSNAPDENIRSLISAETVTFLNLKKQQLRGLKLKLIYQLVQRCRKTKYDLVICHRYKPTYLMLIVAKFAKISALLFVMHASETMSSLARQWLMRLFFAPNMFLAGVSKAIRVELTQALPFIAERQFLYFYNIIDISSYEKQLLSRTQARAQLNLCPEAFIFGHIGRLVDDKDQATLLKAFAIVYAKHPQAKLIIIGDGKLDTDLKALAQSLNIASGVIFTGFIQQAYRLIKAFDVFVLSSQSEAFGRVLLEAMIARVTIVATDVNGIPEVVGDHGSLVTKFDVQGLAQAMLQKIDAPPNVASEGAFKHIRDSFTFAPFEKSFWQSPIHSFIE